MTAPTAGSRWYPRLADLLTGRTSPELPDGRLPGAQMTITDPDGTERFRAALARHSRLDDNNPNLVWIRPLHPPHHDPNTATAVFDPAVTRRRALDVADTRDIDGELQLILSTGQIAHITPARGAELDTLQDWDTWILTQPPHTVADLDALDADG